MAQKPNNHDPEQIAPTALAEAAVAYGYAAPGEGALAALLGGSDTGDWALVQAIRRGFPARNVRALLAHTGFTERELAEHLHLALRTWQRRMAENQPLKQEESEKLARFARVFSRAEWILRDTEAAGEWLRDPNRALGGVSPVSLLDTEEGARLVEAALHRLIHGVIG